jgi:hypothetical protein
MSMSQSDQSMSHCDELSTRCINDLIQPVGGVLVFIFSFCLWIISMKHILRVLSFKKKDGVVWYVLMI